MPPEELHDTTEIPVVDGDLVGDGVKVADKPRIEGFAGSLGQILRKPNVTRSGPSWRPPESDFFAFRPADLLGIPLRLPHTLGSTVTAGQDCVCSSVGCLEALDLRVLSVGNS